MGKFTIPDEVLHDVDLDSGTCRIGSAADVRRLKPESRPPAGLCRQLAAAFEITVFLQEFRLGKWSNGPLKKPQLIFRRPIHVVFPGLKLGRCVLVSVFHKFQTEIPVCIEIGSAGKPCGMPPMHHIQAEIPFFRVKFRFVKFIVPDQLPFFAGWKNTVRVFHVKNPFFILHAKGNVCLQIILCNTAARLFRDRNPCGKEESTPYFRGGSRMNILNFDAS
ncbi:hypothetical protein SDC9_181424 [bioreactor metagenome]|uniref:Uncharacterized protein n=1 Tax=bioreactor metagenome TaxID=1076179 RepID=A0A645H6G4_9ZZZZ